MGVRIRLDSISDSAPALCGFANFGSIAVQLGGLGGLVPEKKELIARLGVKVVAATSLSNLMSAALAGLLLS